MQNQNVLPANIMDASNINRSLGRCRYADRNDQRFQSHVEELKKYMDTYGHMDVTKKENQPLQQWIQTVRQSNRSIQEGRTPRIVLTPYRMSMLREIGFVFKCSRNCVQFKSRIEALKLYKTKYGHMNVSQKIDKSLYGFIFNVKLSLKRIEERRPPTIKMTPDRLEMLQQIGFVSACKTPLSTTSFESRIEDLKRYKAKHGHMNVSEKDDRLLFFFVSNVKQSLKRMQEGRNPPIQLKPDRMKMLKEIGFSFQTRNRVCVPFQARIEALKLFQEKHGHMNVTRKDDCSLYYFVYSVRRCLKNIQEGKRPKINLTNERLQMLHKIGFDFEGGTRISVPFESRIQALRVYQAKHGHINVTKKDKDSSLYHFVVNVKQSLKKMQVGKTPQIQLTPKRVKMLQQIGFDIQNDGHQWSTQENHKDIPMPSRTFAAANEHEEMDDIEHEEMDDIEHEKMDDIEHGEMDDIEHGEMDDIEHEEMEEIEGDLIPKWLMNDEEEEEEGDNGDSIREEILIKIEGETNVEHTKDTSPPQTFKME